MKPLKFKFKVYDFQSAITATGKQNNVCYEIYQKIFFGWREMNSKRVYTKAECLDFVAQLNLTPDQYKFEL